MKRLAVCLSFVLGASDSCNQSEKIMFFLRENWWFCMNLVVLWEIFCMFELNETMRHRDNKAFHMSLNNMASGMMGDGNLFHIKKWEVRSDHKISHAGLWLFKSTEEVEACNKKILVKCVQRAGSVSDALKNEFMQRLMLENLNGT
jgi:hypothetical protein